MGHSIDNGISKKGEHQANLLLKHFISNFKDQNPEIVSSPKLRCIETVEPIAKSLDCNIKINQLLDEGGNHLEKTNKFLRWWLEEAPELVIACSHGDWIPVFIGQITGSEIELSKGGWAEFHLTKGKTSLYSLIQNLNFD